MSAKSCRQNELTLDKLKRHLKNLLCRKITINQGLKYLWKEIPNQDID